MLRRAGLVVAMPDPRRRVVTPPESLKAVEFTAEFTGTGEVKMYRCPACGRSGQDLGLIEAHIETHGGE